MYNTSVDRGAKKKIASWVGLFIWSAFITLIAYGDSVTLPFFFDDLIQIPYASQHSLIEAWKTNSGAAYYRPIGPTIWNVSYQLMGRNSSFLQHAINLLLHAVNGFLVAYLAEFIWSDGEIKLGWRGLLSATLFLLFPFSYQAVPWVVAVVHPLSVTFILGSVICFLHFQVKRRARWIVAGLFFALLALFTHENGTLTIFFVMLMAVMGYERGNGRLQLTALLWFIPLLIWFPIWRTISGGTAGGIVTVDTIIQNIAYFVQGVVYPFMGIGRRLMMQFGWNDMATVIIIAVLTILVIMFIQWRSGEGRGMFLPWLWIAGSALPVVLLLEFGYVISGARLLMLASVGIAWLWADLFVCIYKWLQGKNGRFAIVLTGILFLLFALLFTQNYIFIRQRMDLYLMLGNVIDQASSIAEESDEENVFVNLPSWIAPKAIVYPLGHEGITFLPGYIPFDWLINTQLEQSKTFHLLEYTDLHAEQSYYYGIFGDGVDWPAFVFSGAPIYVTNYEADNIFLRRVGDFVVERDEHDPLATFTTPSGAGEIVLQSAKTVADGDVMTIELHWQISTQVDEDSTIFVHIVDENGQLVAQVDGHAFAGIYPMTLWPPESSVQDVRYAQLEEPFGEYQVYVGLYSPINGERLQASDKQGELWQNNAVLIQTDNK